MLIDQISIFIENRPGRMAEITKLLAKNEIDIRALSIADTTDYGILRLIVNDPQKTTKVLKENNVTCSITKVLAVAIDDKPGGLDKVVQILTANNIAIEYMYAFLNPTKDTAFVMIRVEDNEKSAKVLKEAGVNVVKFEELM